MGKHSHRTARRTWPDDIRPHLVELLDLIDAADECYHDGPVPYATASWLRGCVRRALAETEGQ